MMKLLFLHTLECEPSRMEDPCTLLGAHKGSCQCFSVDGPLNLI